MLLQHLCHFERLNGLRLVTEQSTVIRSYWELTSHAPQISLRLTNPLQLGVSRPVSRWDGKAPAVPPPALQVNLEKA